MSSHRDKSRVARPPLAAPEELFARIAERTGAPHDVEALDAQIWERFGDRCAVMFTDLSGFSRHSAAFGILHFLEVILASWRLFEPVIASYGGDIIKREGDSLLILFPSATNSLLCAWAMQGAALRYNDGLSSERHVLLCVGLSEGPVLRCQGDVFGEAVNSAAKLGEDIARAREVLVTHEFRSALHSDDAWEFELMEYRPPGALAAYRCVPRSNCTPAD